MQSFWADPLKNVGRYIWPANAPDRRVQFALFVGETAIPAKAVRARVYANAVGRYVLYADVGAGPVRLGRGPARSDREHAALDGYEIALSGAPTVRFWAICRAGAGTPEEPLAEMHPGEPGFLLMALFDDDRASTLGSFGTDGSWRGTATDAIVARPLPEIDTFYAVGHFETHTGSAWPAGWLGRQQPTAAAWGGVNAGSWAYFKNAPDTPWGGDFQPWLTPREIAQPEENERAFFGILRRDGDGGLTPVELPLTLAANATAELVCDAGAESIGYPRLTLRGMTALCTYAEVAKRADGSKTFGLEPGVTIKGVQDEFRADQATAREFETFHWRAFRFIKCELRAGAEGGELTGADFVQTGYPFESSYQFSATGPAENTVARIVDVSWRTLKCCTWETYMDCPYYEQLQYLSDTRLQVLCSYLATGDPTLPVQALRAFDRSRTYEGWTQSRYPSTGLQIIPTFSLIYILMIDDYLQHVGDEAIVAELRPGIAPILNAFARYTGPRTGLIARPPYWPFIDWVDEWFAGVPAFAPNASTNLFYLMGLDAAARIYERSKPGAGEHFATRANAFRAKLLDTFSSEREGVVCEAPRREAQPFYTQHAQALAVLADVLRGDAARKALELTMQPTLHGQPVLPASFFFRFYVAEAAAKVRAGHLLWPLLEPFRAAIANGSTTWPESLGPKARSECHAWGSWPLYTFGRHVLGVTPPRVEDGQIVIDPLHCPPLDAVRGTVMTARGPVTVEVVWKEGQAQVKAEGAGVVVARRTSGGATCS